MRILHLLSQTELTGSEAYAFDLAHDQQRNGHHVWVCSDRTHLDFKVPVLHLAISEPDWVTRIKNILKIIRFAQDQQIEVIHAHSRAACRVAFWATRWLKIPFVSTIHGFQHDSISKRLFDTYGDTVIAVCERIQDQLCNVFGVAPEKVKLLRNPLLSDESLAPTSRRPFITFAGRASGPKGRRLIEAFSAHAPEYLSQFREHTFVLLLPGLTAEDRQKILAAVPAPLLSRLKIIDQHVDLSALLKDSQIVVASGRIVLEAFLKGCEVLCLGESEYLGPLSSDRISIQLESNFGDVGKTSVLNTHDILKDVSSIAQSPLSESERHAVFTKLQTEFSKSSIFDSMIEIYRGARLLKVCPELPILMYHRVPDQEIQTPHRIFVTKERFRTHLRFLKRKGFTSLCFQDLSDFWFERKPLNQFPRKPIVITFDDGYQDNVKNAAPLLAEFGMRANFFLLSDLDRKVNDWDSDHQGEPPRLMNSEERKIIASQNCIQSHGSTHRDFRKIKEAEILKEMEDSRHALQKELKQQVVGFAYPFGWIDHRMPVLAKKAGYDFAVNTDRGPLRWTDDRYSLFRINIFPEDGIFDLWRKTRHGYRRRYWRKRGQ